MKLDQLRYFIETAKFQHIGKAAKVLAISPSAISHSIAALEDEFSVKLFEKKGKNIFLTTQGEQLLEKAEVLIEQADSFEEVFKNEAKSINGRIKVTATHGLSSQLISPLVAQLQRQNPELFVEFTSTRSADVIKKILNREADIGFCFSPQDHPDIKKDLLYQGQLIPLISKKRLENLERLEDLNSLVYTAPKALSGVDICEDHPVLSQFGLNNSPSFTYDSYDLMNAHLHHSPAWSLAPDLLLFFTPKNLAAPKTPKSWKAPYTVEALTPKYRPVKRAARKLLEMVSAKISKF